jgi:hypothetical protein
MSSTTLTVRDVLGPLLTTTQMRALGGAYAEYDRKFAEGSDALHTRGVQDVFYDGALAHYAAAERIRSSDSARALVYESRGDALAVKYRGTLVPPSMTTVWNVFPAGLAIHYLRTGDPASLTALEQLANAMWLAWGRKAVFHRGFDLQDYWEPRPMGRIIESFLIAHLLGLPSPAYPIVEGTWLDGPPKWDVAVRQMVTYAAKSQGADGAWRSMTYEGQQAAFNAGILLNVLLDVDRLLPAHADLRPMIHKSVGFLRTQWTPTGFQYASGAFKDGGTGPEPDLTGLLVTPMAWSAMHGGPVTPAFAEDVFAQTVAGAYLAQGKQFNQAFAKSYQAVFVLHPVAGAPVLTPAQRLAAIAAIEYVRRPIGKESKAIKAALAPVEEYLRAL